MLGERTTQATRRLAVGLGALVVVEAVTAVALTLATRWSLHEAVDAFVVSNCVIGVSFGLCGAVIAAHRPRHPVGWLYAIGGALQLLTAVTGPAAQLLHDHGAPLWTVRAAVMMFSWSWGWHIGLVLPVSMLLLPDGRLPSPRWRWVLWAVALTAPLFVVEVGLGSQPPLDLPRGYLMLPTPDDYSAVWTISELRWVLSVAAGVVALVVRYRRGDERRRRQILWLVTAAAVVLLAVTPWALVAGTPMIVRHER